MRAARTRPGVKHDQTPDASSDTPQVSRGSDCLLSVMVAIPRRRSLPFALGIIRSRTGRGRKPRCFNEPRSASRNSSTPRPQRDGHRRVAVHPRRPGAPVSPHPIPRHQQERRIGHEVEQIIEPAFMIADRPTVQLGLDLQYPALGPIQDRFQFVGIHRRHTSWSSIRVRCRLADPLRHVRRLSLARTTTGSPPRPAPSADGAPALPPRWPHGRGQDRTVPTFTSDRSTSEAPSCAPAASPRLRRSPSPWPPCRQHKPAQEFPTPALTADRAGTHRSHPLSTRFEVVSALEERYGTGFSRTPSRLAHQARPVW
jgi:hypothetical protein